MMTTIHMFKNHPNKSNIKFIVLPLVREILHTACDIASDPEKLLVDFGPRSKESHGVNFDFSALWSFAHPRLW